MPIVWSDKMSVGDRVIDADHKKLIELINTIETQLEGETDLAVFTDTMHQLEKYTDIHFEREEEIMKQVYYARHYQHMIRHHELRNEFKQIKEKMFTQIEKFHEVQDVEQLCDLLRHWLMDHVFAEDMLMKPVLSQRIHNIG